MDDDDDTGSPTSSTRRETATSTTHPWYSHRRPPKSSGAARRCWALVPRAAAVLPGRRSLGSTARQGYRLFRTSRTPDRRCLASTARQRCPLFRTSPHRSHQSAPAGRLSSSQSNADAPPMDVALAEQQRPEWLSSARSRSLDVDALFPCSSSPKLHGDPHSLSLFCSSMYRVQTTKTHNHYLTSFFLNLALLCCFTWQSILQLLKVQSIYNRQPIAKAMHLVWY